MRWRLPTTSNRSRQSLPTRLWPLGLGCTRGWVEQMYKYHACAHWYVDGCRPHSVCAMCPFSSAIIWIPFVARYTGPAEEGDRVTQKTQLCFTWRLVADDVAEVCEVQLLCRDAARRGVHLPAAWKSKWNSIGKIPTTDAMADAAVQRTRDEFSLSDDTKLACRHFLIRHAHTYSYISHATQVRRRSWSCADSAKQPRVPLGHRLGWRDP